MGNEGIKRLRLGFVVQRYGVEVNGGAELHCRALAQHLAARSDVESVTVLTSCAQSFETWRNAYPAGVEQLGNVRVERFRTLLPRWNSMAIRLEQRIRAAPHPTWVEQLWLACQGPVLPGLLARLRSLARETDAVTFFTYLYHPTVVGLPRVAHRAILVPTAHEEWAIEQRIYQRLFRLPAAIAFNTPEEREFVLGRFDVGQARHDIVGCGVELPTRDAPAAPVKGPFLLYLGRMVHSKGVLEALQAFLALKQNHPDALLDAGPSPTTVADLKLVLAGGGTLHDLPQHPDVVPLGFVEDPVRVALLRDCLALVMPSRFESLSLVMLEAWTFGRPVVVQSACAATRGHVERCDGGVLYGSAEEFANGLLPLLADAARRREVGRRGRAYVEKTYSWSAVEERFLALVRHVRGASEASSR